MAQNRRLRSFLESDVSSKSRSRLACEGMRSTFVDDQQPELVNHADKPLPFWKVGGPCLVAEDNLINVAIISVSY